MSSQQENQPALARLLSFLSLPFCLSHSPNPPYFPCFLLFPFPSPPLLPRHHRLHRVLHRSSSPAFFFSSRSSRSSLFPSPSFKPSLTLSLSLSLSLLQLLGYPSVLLSSLLWWRWNGATVDRFVSRKRERTNAIHQFLFPRDGQRDASGYRKRRIENGTIIAVRNYPATINNALPPLQLYSVISVIARALFLRFFFTIRISPPLKIPNIRIELSRKSEKRLRPTLPSFVRRATGYRISSIKKREKWWRVYKWRKSFVKVVATRTSAEASLVLCTQRCTSAAAVCKQATSTTPPWLPSPSFIELFSCWLCAK